MREPNKEEAREYLVSDLIEEIQREEEKQSNRRLALLMLKSGVLDEDIEVKSYDEKQWIFSVMIRKVDVRVTEFTDKYKTTDKKVPRFE